MTRNEMINFIHRLNAIADRGVSAMLEHSDRQTFCVGIAASHLRWALAETGHPMRRRIAALCFANQTIGALNTDTSQDLDPDLLFVLNAAQIVLTEIVDCAGREKKHDWRKLYPE